MSELQVMVRPLLLLLSLSEPPAKAAAIAPTTNAPPTIAAASLPPLLLLLLAWGHGLKALPDDSLSQLWYKQRCSKIGDLCKS